MSMYDPVTGKFTLINTCFPTHHLNFAYDANNTLWTSAGGPRTPVIGWLNAKMFEELATSRNHRDGRRSSSTPSAMASAPIMSSPTSRSIRPRTSGLLSACTRSR
jgi:hypothetical protein